MKKTLTFIAVFALTAATAGVANAQTGYGGSRAGGSIVYCTAERTTFCQPASGQVLGASVAPVVTPGQVLGAATFTFTTQMGVGASGPQVSELQNRLRQEGYFNASTTGYFGTATLAAVRAYQSANGISPTGYVGPVTLARLNVSANVAVNASVNTETEARLRSQLASAISQLIALLQAQLNNSNR
jgi:peptidoglycan hydrolase-like protein with peptidoglycan-binding domain